MDKPEGDLDVFVEHFLAPIVHDRPTGSDTSAPWPPPASPLATVGPGSAECPAPAAHEATRPLNPGQQPSASVPPAAAIQDPDPPVLDFEVPSRVWEPLLSGDAPAALRRGAATWAEAVWNLLGVPGKSALAFDDGRRHVGDRVLVAAHTEQDGNLWFVGDVHGDLLAFEAALDHIRRFEPGRASTTVFLGDLVDDGIHAFEVVARVLELVATNPGGYCLLAGNHDEALRWDAGQSAFTSWVCPSEFSEQLNDRRGDPAARRVAEVFIALVERAPRALFFADGLLAAHGGIPQSDLWPALSGLDSLNDPLCLQDFVWTRAHPRAPSRRPDRSSRGAEFGRDDFARFCEIATRALNQPVERMIRGHDHLPERYSLYEKYRRHRLVTVNTLARRLSREFTGPLGRVPCVARWVPGALPEVHRLVVPNQVIEQIYPGAEGSMEAREGGS